MITPAQTVSLHLIMICPRGIGTADFAKIAHLVVERAPEIGVLIVRNGKPNRAAARAAASRPTLVFSPTRLVGFAPERGKVYCAQPVDKLRELELLERRGVPVPAGVAVTPLTRLDETTWGPFTVLKPSRGLQAKGVALIRTHEFERYKKQILRKLAGRDRFYIAQKFIDTGRRPNKFRVLTLFGRPLYAVRDFGQEREPLNPGGDKRLPSIVASSGGPRTEKQFCSDRRVLEVAMKAAAAFRDTPLLGIDIVEEEHSQDLYVLEVNSAGKTWHLSSPIGRAAQAKFNLNYYEQFDALSVAADALIEVTRAEAA